MTKKKKNDTNWPGKIYYGPINISLHFGLSDYKFQFSLINFKKRHVEEPFQHGFLWICRFAIHILSIDFQNSPEEKCFCPDWIAGVVNIQEIITDLLDI